MESIVKEDKIHFYEYMEVELLHGYITTGIEYAINSFLSSSPRLIPLRYYASHISTLINALKDFYFLLKHKAIYAEYFYGLERTKELTKWKALIDVFFWVILPHLLRKVEGIFLQCREEIESAEVPARISLIKRAFVKIFPLLYAGLNTLQAYIKFRYLIFPDSEHYSLEYKLTKTVTAYRETNDNGQSSKYPLFEFLKSPGLFLLLISHKIIGFFYSQENKQSGRRGDVAAVPSPFKKEGVSSKNCPICGRNIRNRAFLRTSGYIFCYACISQYIRSEGQCPVTHIKTTEDSIQVLYE